MSDKKHAKIELTTDRENKRRKRIIWKRNLPEFLDASSSVSIGPFGARRLPELKSLYSSLSDRPSLNHFDEALTSGGRSTSSRHLRRRTGSFQSKKRHRFPAGYAEQMATKNCVKKSQNRKSRRKRHCLRVQHSTWQRATPHAKPSSPPKDSKTIHWLPTHLWHAKRFHMSSSDFFGWKIPLQHANRGPAAVKRLLMNENRTTIQDVSWCRQPLVLKDTLEVLTAYLYRLCPTALSAKVKSGQCFGELILHEPDSFPCNVIGPTKAWFRHSTRCNKDDSPEPVELYLFVHPSIAGQVQKSLECIIPHSKNKIFQVDGGFACFECRGRSTKTILKQALQLSENHLGTPCDHGCITSSKISSIESKARTENEKDHEHEQLREQQQWLKHVLEPKEIILIRHDLSTLSSDTVNNARFHDGWDLYCSSSDAHKIFMALVWQPEAIAIGCIEAFHTFPEKIHNGFPWSYPDSEQGRLFWEGHEASGIWKEYRISLENCRRLKEKGLRRSLATKSTEGIIKQLERIAGTKEHSTNNQGVVVVRGSFGEPFADLIQQCGCPVASKQVESNNKNGGMQRRLRRRQKRPTQQITLSCPSHNSSRRDRAASLESSLSLPALLKCEIRIIGRGSLSQGDALYANELSRDRKQKLQWKDQLGIVVFDGSFDTSIGQVQGIGFVAAQSLLKFLSSCEYPAVTIRKGRTHIIVNIVKNKTRSCIHGIITLIL